MHSGETERSEIVRLVKACLLGPFKDEEIIESSPTDTYLTGILWPEGEPLDGIEDDQDSNVSADKEDDIEADIPGYRVIRPCSIGITFATELKATVMVSLASTSRYSIVEKHGEDNDEPVKEWHRNQLNYTYKIPEGDANTWHTHEFLSFDEKPVHDKTVCLHIKRRVEDKLQILTVTLINKTDQLDSEHRDERCLFQAGIEISSVDADGKGAICTRQNRIFNSEDEDRQSAELLYREIVEFAVGHGIAAQWERPPGLRVEQISTSWMPEVKVKGMSASGHPSIKNFSQIHPKALSASNLAKVENRSQIIATLRKFVELYEFWISNSLEATLTSLPIEFHRAANRNLDRCKEALKRMKTGIEVLEENKNAWHAFALANAAMNKQASFQARGKKPLVWRPFQLAYILLVISGLVKLDQSDRNCLDLLWFPTGGGKTEAYLALTAFQIFFRRLEYKSRRKNGGVDVIMRYTLRLLTVQQFQRAASMICACDEIRREIDVLGSAPISLGLYVGNNTTPNRIEDAVEALEQEKSGQQPRSTPRQLLNCPVCGKELPPSSYSSAAGEFSIEIRCVEPDCETGGIPIPVHTVDDSIYQNPPSLLIGTIDKFAQLPRRSEFGFLFGINSNVRPGLIIQDELHLISGPLGSIAGLYETAIDLMCTVDDVRPKIIGSSATIGKAERQVQDLFDRSVLQFPPPGFNWYDSFFAVRDNTGPDRLYIGLSSSGRSPKFSLQAATAALLQAAQYRKCEQAPVDLLDAFWTTVLYFNSLRELGGAHTLIRDDIPRHMSFLARRLGIDKRNLEASPIELSSRASSRELPEHLKTLEVTMESLDDPFSLQPRDAVLASSMISVGVDIARLGQMLVNGQPKSTAEYIQASSRVGRGLHGMILTLYNFSRPRDISHFEHFQTYHSSLYRNVEATSVTPWAPRARDKALHAVFTAAVRHLASGMSDDASAISFNRSTQEVEMIIESIVDRVKSSTDEFESEACSSELETIVEKWERRSEDLLDSGKELLYWKKYSPFGRTKPHLMVSAEEGVRNFGEAWPTPNSMREVEPSAAFKPFQQRSVD